MNKRKVVITDYWYETLDEEKTVFARLEGLELEAYHCKDEDRLPKLVRDADAVIVQFAPITRKVIESMQRCKVIVRYAIGVDNIDIAAATERGIYVVNVPDYCIDEVSDHAIALLMALNKKLFVLNRSVHEGKWDYTVSKPLFALRGRTLGLVGFGRIPMMVAEKMRAFGMEILCYDPYIKPETASECGVEKVELDALMQRSDFISVHCPLNDETRHLIGGHELSLMKRTAFLINTARGAVVDEAALAAALQSGAIAGAGLDVLEHEPISKGSPLLGLDNVILTPHNGWYSEDATLALQRKVAEEAARVLEGGVPKNLVNKSLLK